MIKSASLPPYYKSPLATSRRKTVSLTLILLVAVGILAGLELTDTTYVAHAPPQTKKIVTAGKPVAAPNGETVKTATNSSTPAPEKTPTSGTRDGDGGAVDTQGAGRANTDSSKWIVSDSGYITVKSPTANSKLESGSEVVGSTKLDSINYRLLDNTVGVIAQGKLSVVDGNFSGKLQFKSKGTGGRLDIFSTDSQNVEYNELQINVSF